MKKLSRFEACSSLQTEGIYLRNIHFCLINTRLQESIGVLLNFLQRCAVFMDSEGFGEYAKEKFLEIKIAVFIC